MNRRTTDKDLGNQNDAPLLGLIDKAVGIFGSIGRSAILIATAPRQLMVTILVVDDSEPMLTAVCGALTEVFGGEGIESTTSCAEALRIVIERPYDIVLLDISMKEMSGLTLLKQLIQLRPAQPVIMLTAHRAHLFAAEASRLGARGYVEKMSAPLSLFPAIKAVLAGGRYFDESLVSHRRTGEVPPHPQ